MGCKKKFTKQDYCVSCGMCMYWYHKTCAGISDEVYKLIETHCKEAPTFWNCTPCASYARGITARVRELEGRVETVEKHQAEQDRGIVEVNKKLDKTNISMKKLEDKVDEATSGASVFKELRERRARRLNVVFYGIGESASEEVEERRGWRVASTFSKP